MNKLLTLSIVFAFVVFVYVSLYLKISINSSVSEIKCKQCVGPSRLCRIRSACNCVMSSIFCTYGCLLSLFFNIYMICTICNFYYSFRASDWTPIWFFFQLCALTYQNSKRDILKLIYLPFLVSSTGHFAKTFK